MSKFEAKKRVLFLMTGSIACYKACQVVSRLVQAGHDVRVVASPAALEFVGAATLEGLSGRPVLSDLWERGRAMDHIHLIRDADLVLAAPATANFINRIAQGLGDDLLTTLFLAHDFKKPFLIAPAMNTTMYLHPATQSSLQKLKGMGVRILETASGVLACGETGFGKLLEPDLILREVLDAFGGEAAGAGAARPSAVPPLKVLITAGGTRERIDDVRVLTNTSTGRSGARLADLLSGLGMEVTLLRAESAVPATAAEVREKTFVGFDDLAETLRRSLQEERFTHVVQMAAVSDYRLERVLLNGREMKSAKTPSGGELTLEFKPAPKLLPELRSWSANKDIRVVGFKLTSGADKAGEKSAVERVLAASDVVVHNDQARIDDARGVHPYTIHTKDREVPLAGFNEMSGWLASWMMEKENS
ncbi:MAG: bifunctional phosphopantothenoylcysteine decarboxylase/phosphopantothenate--cysteine ligase CoaBC [Bdellovibrionaceae bacterium]|nr:bifunctional phosphopantothenoylcysteine decarboxylase/phosphopantothenate--cysteine ligase CoaBC [Pseudobdellovibrionaceae bacterium]